MPGLLVAIEGIDGSGKGTQARMLQEALIGQGLRCALLSFPRYAQTHFGRWIGEFLNGKFGKIDEVNPYLVSLLFAGDRFESRDTLRRALDDNDVVVLDRYVASNIAHQAAKLPENEHARLAEFVEQVEFGVYGLPRPQRVLLLDLPAEQARELIAKKQQRDYTDRAADLHEEDTAYLERVRSAYRRLAEAGKDWHMVHCTVSSQLRSPEDIHAELVDQAHGALREMH